MAHQDARSLSPEAQEDLRRRVLEAIRVEGMKKAHAARTFGVSRQAINNWLAAVDAGGDAALAAKKRGRPAASSITKKQQERIVRHIQGKCPDQMRLPFALWTRDAVVELIKKVTERTVSVWTAGRYLKSWGFTPQKPVRRAYERDPVAVQAWLDTRKKGGKGQAWRERTGITRPTSGIFPMNTAIDAPLSRLRWRTILPSAVPRLTTFHKVVHDMAQPLQWSPRPTNLEPCHRGRTTSIIQPPIAAREPKTVMLYDAARDFVGSTLRRF